MNYWLSLYTAAPECSGSFMLTSRAAGPHVLLERSFGRTQLLEQIPEFLQDVRSALSGSNVSLSVVVCSGPGSLTGMRIGISLAQGFCRAQGAPLYGLTLSQLWSNVWVDGCPLTLDGHNGFFLFARRAGGPFDFVPYSECQRYLEDVERVVGYQQDVEKLVRMIHRPLEIQYPLNGTFGSTEMARWLSSQNDVASYNYREPVYGLPALTSHAKV